MSRTAEGIMRTLIRRDGENWAVCPKSKEINKLTVREIQMGFEMSAKRGLLAKYRHSLPACGFYPCNTSQHVSILQIITYAKLNCMKTEKVLAMLEGMYQAM
jgi:phage FluMu protein Com